MTNYPRQALVGDIGHTNIRFAVVDIDELTVGNYASLSTGMFSGPAEALHAYLKSIPERPRMVGLSVAGPVEAGRARLSQLDWSFGKEDIAQVIEAEHICIVNEFEALAKVLPHLIAHDLHPICGPATAAGRVKAVLGPGTGLGVAALISDSTGWTALPSRGGRAAFSAHTRDEFGLLAQMVPAVDHIAAEDVLSSKGLVALYQALASSKSKLSNHLNAAEVVKMALVGHDPVARDAVDQFVSWLGRFARDVSLLYGATGGVYLAGGMVPRLIDPLCAGAFRMAFESKGVDRDYLSSIPVTAIKAADAGLRGAAVALAELVAERGEGRAAAFVPAA
jgi:glucokinase